MAVHNELWVPAVTFAGFVGLLLFLRVYARAKGIRLVVWRLRLPRLLLKQGQLPQVIRGSLKPEPDFNLVPCTPVRVEWGGVHLTVDSDKSILTNCSGSAHPARITAIIGFGLPVLHKESCFLSETSPDTASVGLAQRAAEAASQLD